jgi:mannose-6-phosphate isomerase-like protein (cupin superfamily)
MNEEKNYLVADFEKIEAAPCPCGLSKRAFVSEKNQVASMHVVEISKDSRPHYHKKMTEIYYVLEGEGYLEIDKDKIPLKPGVSVLIPPHSLHRAVGKLKLINVPVPTFDPEDEWFVD